MNYSDNTRIAKALRNFSDTKETLANNLAEVARTTQREMERAADLETALFWMIAENPKAKIPQVTREKLHDHRDQLRNGKPAWEKVLGEKPKEDARPKLHWLPKDELYRVLDERSEERIHRNASPQVKEQLRLKNERTSS